MNNPSSYWILKLSTTSFDLAVGTNCRHGQCGQRCDGGGQQNNQNGLTWIQDYSWPNQWMKCLVVPIPAWATTHERRRKSITPQMLSRHRMSTPWIHPNWYPWLLTSLPCPPVCRIKQNEGSTLSLDSVSLTSHWDLHLCWLVEIWLFIINNLGGLLFD